MKKAVKWEIDVSKIKDDTIYSLSALCEKTGINARSIKYLINKYNLPAGKLSMGYMIRGKIFKDFLSGMTDEMKPYERPKAGA